MFPLQKKKQPTGDFMLAKKTPSLDTFQIHEAVDVVSWWIQKAPVPEAGKGKQLRSPRSMYPDPNLGPPKWGEIPKKKNAPIFLVGIYGKFDLGPRFDPKKTTSFKKL